MKLYFVRHGKTEWNLENRFQGGGGDSPLLPQSITDIGQLGVYLRDTKFAAIYASPLARAYTTALCLRDALNQAVPVIKDERLREFDLGKLEGMTFDAAEQLYPEVIHDFWHAPDKYDASVVQGEGYPSVIKRGQDFAWEMADKYPDGNVLAVSHGAALCAIMGGILGYPLADIRKHGGLSNSGLSILQTTDQSHQFSKIVWNQTDFLTRKLESSDSL